MAAATADVRQLERIVKTAKQNTYVLTAILGSVAVFVYPYIAHMADQTGRFEAEMMVFVILTVCTALQGGYIPLWGLLAQSGYPRVQALFTLMMLATNVLLNLLLIPLAGIVGAAIATGGTYILSMLYLRILSKRVIRISI
jgi:O-antigen/teichoic acid export membrane protein